MKIKGLFFVAVVAVSLSSFAATEKITVRVKKALPQEEIRLMLADQSVPEDSFVVKSSSTQFDILADLPIEEYLLGVLPAEMPAAWPIEVLKAQAVASRTYALKKMRHRRGTQFHLESSVLDQVYDHRQKVLLPPAYLAKVKAALKATEGEFLGDDEGQPISAHYHADCGGTTEEAVHVWGRGEALGTRIDHSCPQSPLARWQERINIDNLVRQLWPSEGLFLDISEVKIIKRTPSGRVGRMAFILRDGRRRELSGHEFRERMGFSRVKSTLFDLEQQGTWLRLIGRGHGHGVGLCQWGAKSMALQGLNYREILKRYYPHSKLVKGPNENSLVTSVR